MTYDETIATLFGLEAKLGWDLKLERVRIALELLGSPERRYPSVLIAGTNGKGSTAAMAHAALCAAGHRAGLYTSPHLVHFTERIRIAHDEISRPDVVAGVERIRRATERAGIALTFFEMATVLAFAAFAEAAIDVAVVEVGLGGRLDATNASEPLASAVVTIGYDHEQFLGDTLAAIAREKAGVMRPGRAIVLGPGMRREAHEALLEEAARIGARVVEARAEPSDARGLGLAGAHMRANAGVARALLEELAAAEPRFALERRSFQAGFASVRWPGRLEVVHHRPLVVLDGAHNREGMEALVNALPPVVQGAKPRLLFAALADKPWRDLAAIVLPHVSEVVITEVGGARGARATEVAAAFAGALPTRVVADPIEALEGMLAADACAPILVCGSLYLIGAVYPAFLSRRGVDSIFAPSPEVAA
jgi:dihydrofolate synthase / folylpolyglutamate synthase